MDQLHENLKSLRLNYLSEHLDEFLINCEKSSLKPLDMIDRMAELEILERNQRSTSQRIKTAKIGKFRHIQEFDWDHPKSINKDLVMGLFSLDFLKENRNIVIAGPQGMGKTLISKNLAYQAATKGYNSLFKTAAQIVMDLSSAESSVALVRKLKVYTRPKLLVIDEIGYLSFDQKSADLIFEIVNRRYENGSIIITTNLAFKDWGEIFPGSPCVTAMIDRLTHHCEIIKLTGDSYRRLEATTSTKKGKKNG